MSNSEPLMDKIEAKGEGTDDEKKMHRDGTEAEKSLDEILKGAQLEDTTNIHEDTIHDQITLEHVDPDASRLAQSMQDFAPTDFEGCDYAADLITSKLNNSLRENYLDILNKVLSN